MGEDDRSRDGLRHLSGQVRCPRRGAMATINAIERERGSASLRSILWCSLRGGEQWCAEDCGALLAPPVADAPTRPPAS